MRGKSGAGKTRARLKKRLRQIEMQLAATNAALDAATARRVQAETELAALEEEMKRLDEEEKRIDARVASARAQELRKLAAQYDAVAELARAVKNSFDE